MTVDELIRQLQEAKDSFGSKLPVLMLSSSGICSAVESLDSNENAVVIVSYEHGESKEETEYHALKKKIITLLNYYTHVLGDPPIEFLKLMIYRNELFDHIDSKGEVGPIKYLKEKILDGWMVKHWHENFCDDALTIELWKTKVEERRNQNDSR